MKKKIEIVCDWRDPSPEELEIPEFEAVWECIKKWDIGLPQDIVNGNQLYSGATGNHVVAILDALRNAGCLYNSVNT